MADWPVSGVAAAGGHGVYCAPVAVVAAGGARRRRGRVPGTLFLATGSSVGPEDRLQHCSLGQGAAVGTDCGLASCVLMEGARVGRGVSLTNVILGRGAAVEEGAKVGPCCLLGACWWWR